MSDTVASSSVKNLLRRSRFASFMTSVGQVYTTPDAQLQTGDWGTKYQLLATPIGGRPGSKKRMVNMTLPEVDSALGLPVWKSADKSARFIRMWGGEATALRMKPEKGQTNWATDKGKLADPWQAQGERIVVSREYLHKQQQERIEAWRLKHQPTDAEAEQQAREAFVQSAGLPDDAARALFAELWAKWLAFVHAEEGDTVTLARWMQQHGSPVDFGLELNNLRYDAQAKASYFHPDSLANDPTEEDWETILAHAQKRRLPLSDWEAVIRDLHEVGTPEDQAYELFLRERAEAQLPKATAATKLELVESLRDDAVTSEAFVTLMSDLIKSGSSPAQWLESHSAPSFRVPKPLDNPYAAEEFLNPNEHDHAPNLTPDVERMSEAQFARYLESVKTLQPKYRQHLLTKLATNLEKSGSSDLPTDTTLQSLATTDSLVPIKESKDFIRKHFADAVHDEGMHPARHPTGGLQYALPTKLEMATSRPLRGYHLGKVQLGLQDRTQDLHSIGGLVASGSPSNALGGAGLKPLDLGLTSSGQWRPDDRREEDGKYFFRVDRAVLADTPKVVSSQREQQRPLEYSSIARGPDFEFQLQYPLSVEVSRTDYPPESAPSRIRTSPLDAYGRGEKFLGGRQWVSGKLAADATARTNDVRRLSSRQTPSDIVRGLSKR